MRPAFVLCCAAVLGCSESNDPVPVVETRYQLTLVNSQPLPTTIEITGFGLQHRIIDGDLVLAGTVARERAHYDAKPTSGEPYRTYDDSVDLRLTTKGSMVLLTRKWREDSTTVDTGYVEGDLLTIQQPLKSALNTMRTTKSTLKFAKQPSS